MNRWGRWLVLAVLAWLAGVFAWVWAGPAEPRTTRADFVLVLGAAVDGNRPSPVFAARIDHAASLWRRGSASRIMFTGGTGAGETLSEAEAASRYAQAAGVPAQAILLETRSRTTWQNLTNARPIIDRAGGGTVVVVSDRLHLARAMAMADALGYRASPSAAPGSRYRSLRTQVPFALREVYFIHHFWVLRE